MSTSEIVEPAVPSNSGNAAILQSLVTLPVGMKSLEFEDYYGDEVEISLIEAITPNTGAGTSAMKIVTQVASELSIPLMLIPSGDLETRERLIRFYARFGFWEDGEVMRRSP